VPAQTQMDIRRELPHSEIVMMPGLGHYPSDEKPEEFLAIVDRFLADAHQ
jgi:pimeloyl-ACP methyl ester carboxylesterase